MTRARDLGDFIADGAAAELVVDTTTLVVDSTNNRVGIGTASPSQALEVTGTAKLATVDIDAGAIDGAVIGANSAAAGTFTALTASGTTTITTADINGGAIDGTAIGANSASTGAFSTGSFTGDVSIADKIVHTGDINTAIRFPAADTVSFETAGSERLRIASAGQVGIAGANYGTSGQILTSGGSGAAPSWADAGGGGGQFDMTASGSITAGKVVALNSNGTVSTIVNVASDPSTLMSSATNTAINQKAQFPSQAVDHVRSRVVRAYIDQDNSNKGTAVCGQIDGGGNITWGTPFVFYNTSNMDCNLSIVYHEAETYYYIFYKRPDTNEPQVHRISNATGTVLANVNSSGNPGNYGTCSSEGYSGTYDPDKEMVVFSWYTTGQNDGAVAILNQHGIAASAIFNSNDWSQWADMTYDTTNDKSVHVRQYGQNQDIKARVFTVTANPDAISVGAENSSTNVSGGVMPRCTFDPDSGKVVVISCPDGQNNNTYYGLGTVSGTTTSWTNGNVSSTGMNDSENQYDVTYDTGADKILISYRKYGTTKGYMRQGTISGTSLSFGSELEIYGTSSPSYVRIDYLPTSGFAVMTANGTNNALASAVTTVIASTNPNWFGIAAESISDGSSGKITHLGGVNENVSSLAVGTIYYADKTGGLTATDSGYKVGKAIATTKIIITEGNA